AKEPSTRSTPSARAALPVVTLEPPRTRSPAPIFVNAPEPPTGPRTFRVRPPPTFQVWALANVSPQYNVRSWEATVMSMPMAETPFRVSVLLDMRTTGPPGLRIRIPPHMRSPPRELTVFAAVTLASHTPYSVALGTVGGVQLTPLLSENRLSAFHSSASI